MKLKLLYLSGGLLILSLFIGSEMYLWLTLLLFVIIVLVNMVGSFKDHIELMDKLSNITKEEGETKDEKKV